MKFLSDFDIPALEAQLAEWNCKPSHAGRLLLNFFRHSGHVQFDEIKIGSALQRRFGTDIAERQSRILQKHQSSDGTLKLLVGFELGGAVESVLMPTTRAERAAGCISSQIGCAMGCDFCASTKRGLERNLEAGEIVEQFLHLREHAALTGRRLHTLVFMGMGEPMQNLDNVITAIRRIAGEKYGALGWRQITVSTVGIVPGMDKLTDADLNVHLAVSLHAPDDETRAQIVPMNRRYSVAEIMAAARRFEKRTRRIPTIEYCMLAGVNDSDAQAELLAELMRDFRAHVNLIPYNNIGTGLSGRTYAQPSVQRLQSFMAILRAAGVVAHFRQTRGDDVNAACGQLATEALNRESSVPVY